MKNPFDLSLRQLSMTAVCFILLIYFFAMFSIPLWYGWAHLQEVWRSWQAFNVGMLASLSTFFLYQAAVYKDEAKRNRDFQTEKAFLPIALSELTSYLNYCARFLDAQLNEQALPSPYLTNRNDMPNSGFFNTDVEQIFRRCIGTAEEDVANFLSKIISLLQASNARIFRDERNLARTRRFNRGDLANIDYYVMDLIEILCLVDSLWEFARGEERFELEKISRDDVVNALRGLGLRQYETTEFVDRAERRICK